MVGIVRKDISRTHRVLAVLAAAGMALAASSPTLAAEKGGAGSRADASALGSKPSVIRVDDAVITLGSKPSFISGLEPISSLGAKPGVSVGSNGSV